VLSAYFTPMTAIIKERSGTLDKFIGDAVMAFWGAPAPVADHAAQACAAALDMARAMGELHRQWEALGFPRLHARVGIHSGTVVAGNVGSREQMNYTCLGDTVNLASRLESVNKHYGTAILVSGETREKLPPRFVTRRVDAIRVKGRAAPVEIFELLGVEGGVSPWAGLYEEALAVYAGRDFTQAARLFERVLEERPGDGPAGVLLARCREYALADPGPSWDGVHVMESK